MMTHFTADTYLLHSLVSLFVRVLAVLTEALHNILLLAKKMEWHISVGHDHCCVLYIITS